MVGVFGVSFNLREKKVALALTLVKRDMPGRGFRALIRLTFSTNYATPGEAVNWQATAGFTTKAPDRVSIEGRNGWEFRWTPAGNVQIRGQQPTSATAGIIPLDELANGAYPASITGDTNILAYCEWYQ